jgi:hypothetical protein
MQGDHPLHYGGASQRRIARMLAAARKSVACIVSADHGHVCRQGSCAHQVGPRIMGHVGINRQP